MQAEPQRLSQQARPTWPDWHLGPEQAVAPIGNAAQRIAPSSARMLPMSTVSLQELQQDPGALLDRVEAGEHLVVVRGRPVAELRPVPATQPSSRPFGLCAGAFTVPDDFDAPLPEEILRDFEGR
jgi:prevent-host-death family protein